MGSLLRNESFVRLFAGRVITNAGDSLYFVATMWLVYEMTGSPLYSGLVGFLAQVPVAGQFLAGPVVERSRLQTLLVSTQVLQGVLVLAIPLAAWTGHLSLWLVLSLVPLLTAINQFVYPAQSKALPQIVGDNQLVRANSLFSIAYGGTEMTFNALAGIIVAMIGVISMYVLDVVTFAITTVIFLGLTVDTRGAEAGETGADQSLNRYVEDLRAGYDYVRGSVVEDLTLGSMASKFAGAMLLAVLPAFASSFSGARSYGLLLAASGAGALLGAASASAFETYPCGQIASGSYLAAALFAAGALLAETFVLSTVLLGATFIPMGITTVLFSAMFQSGVEDSMLGRVSSVTSSVRGIALPIGSLTGGVLGSTVGVRPTLWLIAAIVGSVGVYFLLHPNIRTLGPVDTVDESALELDKMQKEPQGFSGW